MRFNANACKQVQRPNQYFESVEIPRGMRRYHFRITAAIFDVHSNSSKSFSLSGELGGSRTQDPRLKRALLYLLSYELSPTATDGELSRCSEQAGMLRTAIGRRGAAEFPVSAEAGLLGKHRSRERTSLRLGSGGCTGRSSWHNELCLLHKSTAAAAGRLVRAAGCRDWLSREWSGAGRNHRTIRSGCVSRVKGLRISMTPGLDH